MELGSAEEEIHFLNSLWAEMVIVKQKEEEPERKNMDPVESSSDEEMKEKESESTASDHVTGEESEKETDPEIKQPESEEEKPAKTDSENRSDQMEEGNDAGTPTADLDTAAKIPDLEEVSVATGSVAEKEETADEPEEPIEKTVRRKIRDVEWELNFVESTEAEFDSSVLGTYVYEPVIPDEYEIDMDVELPQIVVNVGNSVTKQSPMNGMLATVITDWTFVDDEYLNEGELALPGVHAEEGADFDTVVSMLSIQIYAGIEGKADFVMLDITGWSCPGYKQEDDGRWPATGCHTFTTELQEGYTLASDVKPLEVQVTLGGGMVYGMNDITGDGYSFNPDNGELTISTYKGSTNWRSDPSKIDKASVLSLNVSDSVDSFGTYSFRGCTGLTSIKKLPGSLTMIGEYAFRDCKGLEVIIIPEGVTKIYSYAFKDCSNLKTMIFLGKDAPGFGSDIFQNISPAPSVYVP